MGLAHTKQTKVAVQPPHVNGPSVETGGIGGGPMTGGRGQRISNASCPATFGDRVGVSVDTTPAAAPVWDPRSPTSRRTPPKKIREIRSSVIIQEQTLRKLAELEKKEEKEQARRRSTQLTSLTGKSGRGPGLLGKRAPRQSAAPSSLSTLPTILSPTNRLNKLVEEEEIDEDENPVALTKPTLETGLMTSSPNTAAGKSAKTPVSAPPAESENVIPTAAVM